MTKKLMKVKKSGPAAKELADALGLPRIKGDWWLLLCEDGAGQRFTLAGGQSGQSPMLGGPLNGVSVGAGARSRSSPSGGPTTGRTRSPGSSMRVIPARHWCHSGWHRAFHGRRPPVAVPAERLQESQKPGEN